MPAFLRFMKKLSHDERIELAKKAIEKTLRKNEKSLKPKTKRILITSSSIFAGTAIAASAGVGLYYATSYSKLPKYPILKDALKASSFKSGKTDIEPIISEQTNGSQKVITAKMGPVKFVSNHTLMFNKDKMSEWVKWFYHDVSWGPEISTLSSINFISGVDAENGSVTEGYHTSNRDGSSIILSPDVDLEAHKQAIYNQALAHYVITDDNGQDNGIFKIFTHKDFNNMSYYDLYKDEFFQNMFIGSINAAVINVEFASTKAETALHEIVSSWDTLDYHGKLTKIASYKGEYDSGLSGIVDTFFRSETKLNLLYNTLLKTGKFAHIVKSYAYLTKLNELIPNDGVALSQDQIEFNTFLKRADHGGSNDPLHQIMTKVTSRDSFRREMDGYYNLSTLSQLLNYSNIKTKKNEIIESLDRILTMMPPQVYSSWDEVIAAVLSPVKFFSVYNPEIFGFGLNKKNQFAVEVFEKIYKDLKQKSLFDAKQVDGSYLYKMIFESPTYSYSQTEIDQLISNNNDYTRGLTGLGRQLQEKYHPGETLVDGSIKPGLAIWKQSDDFFDSAVRRASQEMMYTVSHEYGHHTTLYYAHNISSYDSIKDVIKNEDVSDTSKATFRSEVLQNPSIDAIGSGEKYKLFRDSFQSPIFRRYLDMSSDGDSKTDLTFGRYDQVLNFLDGYQGQQTKWTRSGLEGLSDGSAVNFKPSVYFDQAGAIKSESLVDVVNDTFDSVSQNWKDGTRFPNVWKTKIDGEDELLNSLSDFGNKQTPIPTTVQSLSNKYVDKNWNEIWGSLIGKASVWSEIGNFDFVNASESQKEDMRAKATKNGLLSLLALNPKLPDFQAGSLTLPGAPELSSAFAGKNLLDGYDDAVKVVKDKILPVLKLATDEADAKTKLLDTLRQSDALSVSNLINYLSSADEKIHQAIQEDPHASEAKYQVYFDNYQQTTISFDKSIKLVLNVLGKNSSSAQSDVETTLATIANDGLELTSGNWNVKQGHAPSDLFYAVDYLSKFKTSIIDEASKLGSNPTTPSGALISHAAYENVGAFTRKLFDALFAGGVSYLPPYDGIEEIMNPNFVKPEPIKLSDPKFQNISEKFKIWTQFVGVVKGILEDPGVTSLEDFKMALFGSKIGDQTKTGAFAFSNFRSVGRDQLVAAFDEQISKYGSIAFFDMKEGQSAADAVVFVFNQADDEAKYRARFSTVVDGKTPTESFLRYETTYVESLTRVWNQLAFSQYPELLTTPGAYFSDDQMLLLSMGEKLYNTVTDSANLAPDNSITASGSTTKEMFAHYLNIDKTIAGISRSRADGLYSFFGYLPEDANYKSLVFSDLNNNVVATTDLIYDVDNFHYYKVHGDFQETTSIPHELHRHSWMTEFEPMGNFANALLKPGEYHLSFWDDKNNNNKIDAGELVPVENKDLPSNGKTNSNGKPDFMAEIIGQPFDSSKQEDDLWTIKVNNIRI